MLIEMRSNASRVYVGGNVSLEGVWHALVQTTRWCQLCNRGKKGEDLKLMAVCAERDSEQRKQCTAGIMRPPDAHLYAKIYCSACLVLSSISCSTRLTP